MPWARADLTYCTNVHPGCAEVDVLRSLNGPIRRVCELRGLDTMACGLWLPRRAASEVLGAPGRLADGLTANGLALMALNGFPYSDFHAERVKGQVYVPAWDQEERLQYTLDLARILTRLLDPEAGFGAISTVPLGFARGWSNDRQEQALKNLCDLAIQLAKLADRSGRPICVCLEPEPGCVLETTDQVLRVLGDELPRAGRASGVSRDLLQRHVGVCFDVCHQAVCFEQPGEALLSLHDAGIQIGKIQISNALEITEPTEAVLERFAEAFGEPRYLHQVRAFREGALVGVDDFPDALPGSARGDALPSDRPWRVHYHVPIQRLDFSLPGIRSTRDAIEEVLDVLQERPELRPHLEVETYTWGQLPPGLRPSGEREMVEALLGELTWLEAQMSTRGLLAEPVTSP